MKQLVLLLALLVVSGPSLAQDTFIDLPKAVVKFDGVAKTGNTYTKSGNTIVVTKASSAWTIRQGDGVYLDFTSGSAIREYFIVNSVAGNTFTVTATRASGNTGGSVSVRTHVTVHMNIASVLPYYELTNCQFGLCDYHFINGRYIIKFATPFADDRYAAVGAGRYLVVERQTAAEFEPQYLTYGGNKKDQDYGAFAFYGAQ